MSRYFSPILPVPGFGFQGIFCYSEAPFIILEEKQNGDHLLKIPK